MPDFFPASVIEYYETCNCCSYTTVPLLLSRVRTTRPYSVNHKRSRFR